MNREELVKMEDKAKKARKIVNRIDELLNNVDQIKKVETVKFTSFEYNISFNAHNSDVIFELKQLYIKCALKDILRLEQSLEEL